MTVKNKKDQGRNSGPLQACPRVGGTNRTVALPEHDVVTSSSPLDGHVFGGIDAHFEEEDVVFDEVAFLEHLVRHEAREAEAERVRLARRPLKVLPAGVRYERLDDVARLVRIGRLLIIERQHQKKTEPR